MPYPPSRYLAEHPETSATLRRRDAPADLLYDSGGSVDYLATGASTDGSEWWRLRVGDLRVIHDIDDEHRLVVVLKAARRNERTYRR